MSKVLARLLARKGALAMTLVYEPKHVPSSTFDLGAPKLFVSDLDGTLLRSDGRLSIRTIDALARLHQSGVDVLFATARPASAALRILRGIPFSLTVIASNGAVVYEAETNELHRIRALSRAEVSEILSHVRRHFAGATVAIDGTRTRVVDPTWPEGTASVVSQPQLWPLDPHTLPRVAVICIMVLNAWSDHRDVPRDWPVTVTSSASGLIEFSAGLANKLSALRWYCKRAGISLTDVLAFGDMPNDLDVLTSVGVGVAVGNAHEAVLAAANFVALTNDQDGVAAFLETHVLDRLSASVRPNPQVAI